MKVKLGSTNQSKKRSVSIALDSLGISDYEIECLEVPSNVSSKPLNDDILQGAKNRNINLISYLNDNSIDFDLVISIEGGYEKIGDKYFIVTYASIIDGLYNEYCGKSIGLEITELMYEWVKKGKSLNSVIESVIGNVENKKNNGISGYLTSGVYKRDVFESSAVQSALLEKINVSKYKQLDDSIIKKMKKSY